MQINFLRQANGVCLLWFASHVLRSKYLHRRSFNVQFHILCVSMWSDRLNTYATRLAHTHTHMCVGLNGSARKPIESAEGLNTFYLSAPPSHANRMDLMVPILIQFHVLHTLQLTFEDRRRSHLMTPFNHARNERRECMRRRWRRSHDRTVQTRSVVNRLETC